MKIANLRWGTLHASTHMCAFTYIHKWAQTHVNQCTHLHTPHINTWKTIDRLNITETIE